MDIAIIGYGKMGHTIEKVAVERGLTVTVKIDPAAPDATHKEISREALEDVDVCIEFTAPEVAVSNIKKIAELKKDIVVGTTGWYDQMAEVKRIVEQNDIGFIYSPNFSIGVNIFFESIKHISKLMKNVDAYGVAMTEIHHIHKKDAPSGTAKKIAEIIKKHIGRIDDVDIKSIREGEVPGTHTVTFESGADRIKLEHEAKNREGFAEGAVIAAEWIVDKNGFFTIEDLMKDVIG
ncbi:MAG TPA: dihydrodipicolinate reductase C-terminal domain-containing protein [Candidatus Nanoarchaeia archaeon]|nr:dihydrodipicolinate reductase C-terminal domain-containing protein [Candidatus Nanoarchaeia archaeon]